MARALRARGVSLTATFGLDGEEESCASAGSRLRPDFPAVVADDSVHDGEANPGSFELCRLVEALERLEELARVRSVIAHAIVAHVKDELAVARLYSKLDAAELILVRELPGISKQ